MRHEGTSAQYREREYNTHAYGLFIVTSQSVRRSNEPLWLFFSFFFILPRKENVYDLSHLRIIRSPELRIQQLLLLGPNVVQTILERVVE